MGKNLPCCYLIAMIPVARNPHGWWRRDPESNRARRICNPLSAESAKYATEGNGLRMERLDGRKCLQLSKNLPDGPRRSRPMRQSRYHGRKAVNPYSNIAGSGPASARHFAPQFQRKGAL